MLHYTSFPPLSLSHSFWWPFLRCVLPQVPLVYRKLGTEANRVPWITSETWNANIDSLNPMKRRSKTMTLNRTFHIRANSSMVYFFLVFLLSSIAIIMIFSLLKYRIMRVTHFILIFIWFCWSEGCTVIADGKTEMNLNSANASNSISRHRVQVRYEANDAENSLIFSETPNWRSWGWLSARLLGKRTRAPI